MSNEVQIYLDHLKQYWDRQTYSLIPNHITNDPLFIKALNYLKLKYGSLQAPILLDDDYFISQDIYKQRSRIRSKHRLDLNKEVDATIDDEMPPTKQIIFNNEASKFYMLGVDGEEIVTGNIVNDSEEDKSDSNTWYKYY